MALRDLDIFEALFTLIQQLPETEIEEAMSAATPHLQWQPPSVRNRDRALQRFRASFAHGEEQNNPGVKVALAAIAKYLVDAFGDDEVQEVLRLRGYQLAGDEITPVGVNIEVPTQHLSLTGHPPSVQVTGGPTTGARAAAGPKVVESAEEIDQATKERFSKEPTAVLADARRAMDITVSLRLFIRDLRLNSPDAKEAIAILDRQEGALKSVISVLESKGETEEARDHLIRHLSDVLESLLEALKDQGVMRGIIAAAALVALGAAGVQVGWLGPTLAAASITGTQLEKLKNLIPSRNKDDK